MLSGDVTTPTTSHFTTKIIRDDDDLRQLCFWQKVVLKLCCRINVRDIKLLLYQSYIIGTNLLTKFHEDRKINVASREKCPTPGRNVFQPTGIIFELVQDIIGMNLPTKKTAPPLGSHVFQANIIIFKLIQDIIETNLLTKFHEDWTINVASRVLTRKNAPPPWWPYRTINVASIEKNDPSPGGHVFQPTGIIFELVQDIIGMNLLTKFHEDWTIDVASRVHLWKNAPPLGSHVFQAKFHDDGKINVASRVLTRKYRENCPAPWGPCFSPIWTIFELVRDINETNVLTKFHDDWANIVTSRVFTRNTGTAPQLHEDWSSNVTSTHDPVLNSVEFHEYWTMNVASRVFTRQNVDAARRTTDDGQKAITKAHHKHVVLR
ncbi:hypothetical protein DPMN_120204 [Dreissena polymorpha]|uniref:Uncharacterized protein n=1 Tax=Dreissena polymorpha TaxID=45954 RepID=A0A9D4GKE3_DREPO|nr:hypothetical protein DPMN_120204 [Dreissena polymorpha]